jgi:hypothetical protein
MATQLLIDTAVLIDYLRGYPDAVSHVEAQQERLLISVVTWQSCMLACVKARNGCVWSVSCGRLTSSHSTSAWRSKAVSIAVITARVTMWGWLTPSSRRRQLSGRSRW